MKVNGIGRLDRSMEEATKYGATAVYMKGTGKMTKLTDEAGSFMLMATFMMAIGRTIRPMATESIPTRMVRSTKDTG